MNLELLYSGMPFVRQQCRSWGAFPGYNRRYKRVAPSWYYYREIYAATVNYLVERKEALVFVDEPFPKSRYYKITLEGRQLLREEGYPVTR